MSAAATQYPGQTRSRLSNWAAYRGRQLASLTSLPPRPTANGSPRSAVVVAIVRKQALRVNGHVRTTVVSLANKSVALDLPGPNQIPRARVFLHETVGWQIVLSAHPPVDTRPWKPDIAQAVWTRCAKRLRRVVMQQRMSSVESPGTASHHSILLPDS